MLERVTAVRFDRMLTAGRTRPSLMVCEREDGEQFEVVVKLAKGCDLGVRSLMAEAVAAMFAADLDLPVPRPFLVAIERQFAVTIPQSPLRDFALESLGWNFGSLKLPPGYGVYPRGKSLPQGALQTAAEILAFDIFIANDDRRPDNPNLLLRGDSLAIFDHELAFPTGMIIGWKAPWEPGGVVAHRHVLFNAVRGKRLDFTRFSNAITSIDDQRLEEYRQALPTQWRDNEEAIDKMLAHIRNLRDNSQEALRQLIGALQ